MTWAATVGMFCGPRQVVERAPGPAAHSASPARQRLALELRRSRARSLAFCVWSSPPLNGAGQEAPHRARRRASTPRWTGEKASLAASSTPR